MSDGPRVPDGSAPRPGAHPSGTALAPADRPARSARFAGRSSTEIYLQATPAAGGDLRDQARSAYESLFAEVRRLGALPRDIVTDRLFLGDIAADLPQARAVRSEAFAAAGIPDHHMPAGSFIQQPPAVPGRRFELQAFAMAPGDQGPVGVRSISGPTRDCCGKVVRTGDGRRVFLANVVGGRIGDGLDFAGQASLMFRRAESCLAREGLSYSQVVRTWIYLADIDRDYAALNRARRAFLTSRSVNPPPASTGIQGVPCACDRGCAMDVAAIGGNGRFSVRAISSPTMNEAPAYGSDFSRGMRIDFEDHALILLSGTASIDAEGRVVDVGDIDGQVVRMLLNIERLLATQGAGFADLVSAVTYLKRPADLPGFLATARSCGFPDDLPHTICVAGVCRPEWLVEIEATAILA